MQRRERERERLSYRSMAGVACKVCKVIGGDSNGFPAFSPERRRQEVKRKAFYGRSLEGLFPAEKKPTPVAVIRT